VNSRTIRTFIILLALPFTCSCGDEDEDAAATSGGPISDYCSAWCGAQSETGCLEEGFDSHRECFEWCVPVARREINIDDESAFAVCLAENTELMRSCSVECLREPDPDNDDVEYAYLSWDPESCIEEYTAYTKCVAAHADEDDDDDDDDEDDDDDDDDDDDVQPVPPEGQ